MKLKMFIVQDEYIKDEKFISKENLIKNSDIIIVATPHDKYKKLKISKKKTLIDIWSIFKNEKNSFSKYKSS